MSSPILHIKDAYYFEVPKFLYRRDFESRQDLIDSGFEWAVRDSSPDSWDESLLDAYNQELSGKIVIPQPFGTA